jgi:hypothetical protein
VPTTSAVSARSSLRRVTTVPRELRPLYRAARAAGWTGVAMQAFGSTSFSSRPRASGACAPRHRPIGEGSRTTERTSDAPDSPLSDHARAQAPGAAPACPGPNFGHVFELTTWTCDTRTGGTTRPSAHMAIPGPRN